MSAAFKLECKTKDDGKRFVFIMTGAHLAQLTRDKGEFSIGERTWGNNITVKRPDKSEFIASFKDITDLEGNSINDRVEQYVNARRKGNAERYADIGQGLVSDWSMLTSWHLFLRSKNRHPVNSPKANVKMYLKWSAQCGSSRKNGTTEIDVDNYEEQLKELFVNGHIIITAIQEFSS